jgi:plasmid maintenance system antidote protein VapI
MSADFWMNLQLRWDLYKAEHTDIEEIDTIKPRSGSLSIQAENRLRS